MPAPPAASGADAARPRPRAHGEDGGATEADARARRPGSPRAVDGGAARVLAGESLPVRAALLAVAALVVWHRIAARRTGRRARPRTRSAPRPPSASITRCACSTRATTPPRSRSSGASTRSRRTRACSTTWASRTPRSTAPSTPSRRWIGCWPRPARCPGKISRHARAVRDEQARRVATLEITTNVPATHRDRWDRRRKNAAGKAGGDRRRHAPRRRAQRWLSSRAPRGHRGRRDQRSASQLELAPSELRLAHLAIHAAVPDAEVLVDGQRVGRTPLPGSIAVPPGRRVVELRRAGYRSERREVTVDDGATGELAFELARGPDGDGQGRTAGAGGERARPGHHRRRSAARRLPRTAAAAAGRAPAARSRAPASSTPNARSTFPRAPTRRSR